MERMSLLEYFSNDEDPTNFFFFFKPFDLDEAMMSLSSKLKDMHARNEVPVIKPNLIFYDGKDYSFAPSVVEDNVNAYSHDNVVKLTKLLLGCYFSSQGNIGFVDYSNFSNEDLLKTQDNGSSFVSVVPYPDFQEYATALFNGEEVGYYCDYVARKNNSQDMAMNSQGIALSLRNGNKADAAGFDWKKSNNQDNQKIGANVTPIFFPLLIGLSLAATLSIYLIFKYL